MKTVEEFINDRLDEYQELIEGSKLFAPLQALIDAWRELLVAHKSWPALIQEVPEFTKTYDPDNIDSIRLAISQKIEWLTREEYLKKFDKEAPTAPFIRSLLSRFVDHPDFNRKWLE